jgi:hypothetical protein
MQVLLFRIIKAGAVEWATWREHHEGVYTPTWGSSPLPPKAVNIKLTYRMT